MKSPFRLPKDMTKNAKEAMSIRINPDTKQILTKHAEKHGLTVTYLISEVLNDYARYLQSESKKGD